MHPHNKAELTASLITDNIINKTISSAKIDIYDSFGTLLETVSSTDTENGVIKFISSDNIINSDNIFIFAVEITEQEVPELVTRRALFFGRGNSDGFLFRLADGRHGRIIKFRLGL